MKRGIRWSSLGLVSLVICFLAKPDVSRAQCEPGFLYLAGVASDLELDPLDIGPYQLVPGDLPDVPSFIDSPSLTKAAGYRLIGTWSTGTGLVEPGCTPTVPAVHPHVWLGLRNGDDQGTQFDLRAELIRSDAVIVAEGEIHCVKGVTRNPAKALEVIIPFNRSGPPPIGADPSCDPSDKFTVDTDSRLFLRLFARIATGDDAPCKGHSSATGLRLYYGAISRPSRVYVGDNVCCTPGCDVPPPCPPDCHKPPVRD